MLCGDQFTLACVTGSIDEGVQTVDLDHHSSNGKTASAVSGVSGVVANGHGGLANSSHGAELGQLQAQVSFIIVYWVVLLWTLV